MKVSRFIAIRISTDFLLFLLRFEIRDYFLGGEAPATPLPFCRVPPRRQQRAHKMRATRCYDSASMPLCAAIQRAMRC